jgi:LacI family transcriptional regulator
MGSLTIRHVAARAGVSVATVSNVLNRPGRVATPTRQRVEAAIQEIGFVRNSAARQLRGAKSQAIGLVVFYIDNPFFADVARGVEDAAGETDHLVILCNSGGERARERRQLRLLEEQRVAGILMTPIGKSPPKLHDEIRKRGTPIVLLDRRSTRRDQCSVGVDDVFGGKLVAEHLAAAGHRRIALVNGPRSITQCADRRTGFLARLAEHGLSVADEHDVEMDAMTITAGEEAAAILMGSRSRPTAIFCTNDLLAIGAEHTALAAGFSIPDDVAMVGYDDVPFASTSFVPLSSVRQPAYELGYRAAKLLLQEATAGAHAHECVVFEPELVVRESSTLARNGIEPGTRDLDRPAALEIEEVEPVGIDGELDALAGRGA